MNVVGATAGKWGEKISGPIGKQIFPDDENKKEVMAPAAIQKLLDTGKAVAESYKTKIKGSSD